MTDLVERLRRDGIKYQTDTFDEAVDRIEADAARLEKAREALEPFANRHVLEPTGAIIGLERYHFERAANAFKELSYDR